MDIYYENNKNLFIDTEDDSKGNFICGVLFNEKENKYYTFKEKEKMRKYILNLKNCIVWAHNVCYDIGNLFDLSELNFKYIKGKFIEAIYNNNGCYIKFWDSMNLFPFGVSELGKLLKIRKRKMPKLNKKNIQKIIKYCKRDVEIIFLAISKLRQFLKENFKIEIQKTISAVAFKIFKKYTNFYDFSIPSRYLDFAKQSYFGGRVEILKYGEQKGTLYYNDVNSMYPAVMRNIILPDWRFLKYKTKNLNLNYYGILKIKFEQNLNLPILPIRDEKTKIIKFLNGEFIGTYPINEIIFAVKNGIKIKKIYYGLVTKRYIKNLFTEFVDKLYDLRKNTKDEFIKFMIKLILNSLYGKFAFSGEIETLKKTKNIKTPYLGIVKISKDNKLFFSQKNKIYTKYMNPILSSYITAEARIKLYGYIKKYYDNVIYYDTDGIITNKKIVKKTDELGELALKKTTKKGGIFILPKLYAFGDDIKSKGFPIKSKKEFDKFLKNKYMIIKKPVKIKESIKTGKKINVWEKIKKELKKEYDKRIVLPNGETIPIKKEENLKYVR